MYYKTLRSTGRHIPKYVANGCETDVDPTDLVENYNCETCENCSGEGCKDCDFEGYIDYSEPNGMN